MLLQGNSNRMYSFVTTLHMSRKKTYFLILFLGWSSLEPDSYLCLSTGKHNVLIQKRFPKFNFKNLREKLNLVVPWIKAGGVGIAARIMPKERTDPCSEMTIEQTQPHSAKLLQRKCVPPVKSSRCNQEVWWTDTQRLFMLLSKS